MNFTSKNLMKSFRLVILSFICAIVNLTFSFAGSPKTLAVMDMETTNITNEQANRVSEQVRQAANRENYRLVNEWAINNAIKREGLRKSVVIASDDLAMRVGRSAGVQQSLTGLVSRMEDLYVITVTLLDVNNGQIRQATRNCKGNFDTFLTNSIKEAVTEVLKNN